MINIRSAKQMDLARIETIYNHIHDEEVGIVPCVFNGIPDADAGIFVEEKDATI